jgi:hypothetical protein
MKNRVIRAALISITVVFGFGLLSGCPSYTPAKNGVCNPGRVWVPPAKNDKGDWVAGYCTWADQAPQGN